MLSTQPYLIRAIHEWILDNEFTPYLLVNAKNDYVQVPRQFVEDGKIVLNIASRAVNDLELGNDHIHFNARFDGKSMEVGIPITAVLAIYAKENGQGMVFDETGDDNTPPPEPPTDDKPEKPRLKLVK